MKIRIFFGRRSEQRRLRVETFGAEFSEGFFCFAALSFGLLLPGYGRIDSAEQFDLGIIGFDGALH